MKVFVAIECNKSKNIPKLIKKIFKLDNHNIVKILKLEIYPFK